MKYLKLTKNKRAIVDDEDFSILPKKWCFDGRYAVKRIGNKKVYLHRFLGNPPKGKEVDHINGDKLDNRRENLRVCEKYQNQMNMKVNVRSTTGFRGVSRYPYGNKWRARIQVRRESIPLGYFDDIEDAVRAYNQAAIKYYGEFARLNSL